MPRIATASPRMQLASAMGRMARKLTPAATVRIRGAELQAIRDRILTRDKGVCQCKRCKADGIVRLAHQVDHVVPLWKGGAEDDTNRQAINRDCHDLKSADEARERASLGLDGGHGARTAVVRPGARGRG